MEATKQGAGSIKLSWVAPEDDGGAKVEQYCIIVNELDEDDDLVSDPPSTRAGIMTVDAADEAEGDSDQLQPAWRARQHAHQHSF